MPAIFSNVVSQPPEHFKKHIAVTSPLSGKVKPLATFEDPSVQMGYWGVGACIELSGSKVIAPFSAKVEKLRPSGYEVTLRAANGLRMWIKIGSQHHSLLGERCQLKVKEGDVIRSGMPLMLVDPYWLRQNQYDTDCAVTFLNGDKLSGIMPTSAKSVVAGDDRLFNLYI